MTAAARTDDLLSRRAAAVGLARQWIGTPYRHRASRQGVGADCLGLLRGVWRVICGHEPRALPAYSDDWLELTASDVLMAALDEVMLTRAAHDLQSGTVLAFKFGRNRTCKHVGVLTDVGPHPKFVHAYSRYGVVETSLDQVWRRRIAGSFDFPPRST